MIGGHAEMRGALLDHLEHGIEHADDRVEGAISSLVEAARSVEVTDKLVGAIDQVDDHAGLSRPPPRKTPAWSRPVGNHLERKTGPMFSRVGERDNHLG